MKFLTNSVSTQLPTTFMSNRSVKTTTEIFVPLTFMLQWNDREKTLKDIRNVLYKAFGHLSVRVEIVVIQDGSVVMVCWAPQHLMKELVRLDELKWYKLREMGVVKLTIGEVIIDYYYWLTCLNNLLIGIITAGFGAAGI